MLKLMYITNRPEIALIAQDTGVDRIFVDMEYIGKEARQAGLDTVKSRHTVQDVERLSQVLTSAELLVRVNPIHEKSTEYCSSKTEIDEVIKAGADIVMLPYFKSICEIEKFLEYVGGRAKTMLLLETPEAVDIIDDILELSGIDNIHIGLNDLSLGYGMKFMFELLTDGTVECLCAKMAQKGIAFGFGGIAALGKGLVPAEMIIKEHYRLGSGCAILSRSFCNSDKIENLDEIQAIFKDGLEKIRALEKECKRHMDYFLDNKRALCDAVNGVK